MAKPSSQSTSSTAWNRPCCVPCNARHPPSQAFAAPTSFRTSPTSRPPPSQGTSVACASLACSNASTEPIATTSPKSAAPPSQHAPTSPKTFSFPPSHDKIFAQNSKSRSTRAYEVSDAVVLEHDPEKLQTFRTRSCDETCDQSEMAIRLNPISL